MSGLIAAAKAGRGQVLVLRGEAGIGKTALLDFMVDRATGCRVSRATGVESEMEFPFAGLHQLCAPFLDRLSRLAAPQQDALGTAFRLREGHPPDRLTVGLAVLALLEQVAEEGPLLCIVDDAQWLDRASAQAIDLVARRLAEGPLAMVLAVRDAQRASAFDGLPEVVLCGLPPPDAAALLLSVVPGAVDRRVRNRILAESDGNPLALLELPRELSTTELVFGGEAVSVGTPVVRRLERRFRRQVESLPTDVRRLLLAASAEPVGDLPLLRRAAERLGIGSDALTAADATGLVDVRQAVRFRHPLVRSAVYRSAAGPERREVHRALADATDPDREPDRRAWHRALAAVGPDETVAAELERSAGRALSIGGLAAAAAFAERAAALTPDPAHRVSRSLDAAAAHIAAGALDAASALLTATELAPLGEADRARTELLRARSSLAAGAGDASLPLLLSAASRLESLDVRLARDTYLDALCAGLFAGRLASGPGARQVAEAVRRAPRPDRLLKADVLLDGLGLMATEGHATAVPACRRAVEAFLREDCTLDEALRFAWLAAATAGSLWDDASWDALTRRHVDAVRRTGALGSLPLALTTRAVVHLFTGDLDAAEALVGEARAVTGSSGSSLPPYGEIGLRALQGRTQQTEGLVLDCLDDVRARREGIGVSMALWAQAVLCNGRGRYREATVAAREAAADPLELGPARWALGELVEAGVRSGDRPTAEAAMEELSVMARASGTDWALGLTSSRAALLCRGSAAEACHREAVQRLRRTGVHVELARAQLLYGEWLRREGRRVDARAQLRAAVQSFAAMGAGAFADRARHELAATGETVRKRTLGLAVELTAQESHIAGLAAEGLSNPEIGAALCLSPRTVEWHLAKIFPKLGVSDRRELRHSLPVAARRGTGT